MPMWEVVGGADKGGILVREGQDLKSPATADRLSTGAIVEQLELVGERLHYKLSSGSGPETGWVSIKLTGKELLVPHEAPAAPADPAEWPARLQAALAAAPGEGTLKDAAPWLGSVGKAPKAAKLRLVIFSWTGNRGGAGSAHQFIKWPKMLAEACPETWQVCEVKYPGRSSRMKEPNATAAREIATAAAEAILKAGAPGPTVLFGFSFGAILAYETAVLLGKKGAAPLGLAVASAEHPGWGGRAAGAGADGGPTKATSDEAFEKVLREKGGTNVILDGPPEMKKMYLPVIRSDMIMEEAYGAAPPQHEPLACPVVAFRGKECPLIPRAEVEPWLALSGCGEGTPTRVEELSAGLVPFEGSPWLCDWYLCQGEQSAEAMVKAIARDFGGAAA